MKKGFILTLMLALVMTAFVAQVDARSPIIRPLPTIILSNDGDNTNGTNAIFRGEDLIDLLDENVGTRYINWNNETYTSDTFHLYFYQDAADTIQYKAYDQAGAQIDGLSGTEYGDLIATGDYTGLSTALDIIDPAQAAATLSVYNDTLHSGVANLRTATAADGVAEAGLTAGTDIDASTGGVPDNDALGAMTLVAGVENLDPATMTTATASMEIYSILGGSTGVSTDTEYSLQPTAPDANWVDATPASGNDIIEPATTFGTGGFSVTSDPPAGKVVFGSWRYAVNSDNNDPANYPLKATGMTDRFHYVKALVRSNSGSMDTCPGFRVQAINQIQTHISRVVFATVSEDVDTTGNVINGGGTANAPYLGNDMTVKLCFTPPLDGIDMGDSGPYASITADPYDARGYTVSFDLIHGQAGDTGDLEIVELSATVHDDADLGAAEQSVVWSDFQYWTADPVDDSITGNGYIETSGGVRDLRTGTTAAIFAADTSFILGLYDNVTGDAIRIANAVPNPLFTVYGSDPSARFIERHDDQVMRTEWTIGLANSVDNYEERNTSPIRIQYFTATNDSDGDGVEGEYSGGDGSFFSGSTPVDFTAVNFDIKWVENFGAQTYGVGKYTGGFPFGEVTGGPASPKAAGSTYVTYTHMHKVRDANNAPYIFTQIDAFNLNAFIDASGNPVGTFWDDDKYPFEVQGLSQDRYLTTGIDG